MQNTTPLNLTLTGRLLRKAKYTGLSLIDRVFYGSPYRLVDVAIADVGKYLHQFKPGEKISVERISKDVGLPVKLTDQIVDIIHFAHWYAPKIERHGDEIAIKDLPLALRYKVPE